MPDISMCRETECPLRQSCYRNEASGTKPSEHWQAWFVGYISMMWATEKCEWYWPVETKVDQVATVIKEPK